MTNCSNIYFVMADVINKILLIYHIWFELKSYKTFTILPRLDNKTRYIYRNDQTHKNTPTFVRRKRLKFSKQNSVPNRRRFCINSKRRFSSCAIADRHLLCALPGCIRRASSIVSGVINHRTVLCSISGQSFLIRSSF